MGFDKLAAPLAGKPVLRRSLEALTAARSVRSVVLVCPADRWALLEGMEFTKPVIRVDGGADRHDSVAAGLAAIHTDAELVAVHDGARPLVSPEDIDRCVEAAAAHHAATLAKRATETMKRSDANDFSLESVDRENLWCMETPQVFSAELLREAYQKISSENLTVTDEVSALQHIGKRVKFIPSSSPNLKITTPSDLLVAEAILKSKP